MEGIEKRRNVFKTALKSLGKAIDDFKLQDQEESLDEYRKSRDSLIQRFEYCTDIFWKYLNDYLRLQLGISLEIARPKTVIKESYTVGLITRNELDVCRNLIEDRNLTSHTYHEELAEHIAYKISRYYELMDAIVVRLFKRS